MRHTCLNESQIAKMYSNSYYLLSIFTQLKFSWSTAIPTAGVLWDGTNVCLAVNEQFYKSLTEDQQISLILHEVLHVEYQHLFANRTIYDKPMRLNMAQDLVINSHPEIAYLKQAGLGIYPEQYNLPEHETTDYYYRNLPDDAGQCKGNCKSSNDKDAQGNNECNCAHAHKPLPPEAAGKVSEVKARAAKACETMRRAVTPIVKPFDWRTALRNYVASADDYERKTSYKKSNRRTNCVTIPGHKKERFKRVAVVIDTSGSMLSFLQELAGQVCNIASTGDAEVHLLQCDSQVTYSKPFKASESIELVGGGGTEYQPGLDAAAKLNPDVIIYLGDMEHFDQLQKPKVPVIWCNTVNGNKPQAHFGKFLKLG